ncbi:hypothetical protein HanXRQr2_Chr05g0195801 [Helianthus annuus]|uniref:Uncharacterized protein n=1 Tax=Helianthus annuus TaxID=4232 RepID=A0A9K3IWV6_HELAN|nr:hypothetical protein HanXRQr2_Chr05g0195801 [Helianthus annuus]KAJ0575318.1 hypothetical protein HanIR_Chr05g0211411 [Helianthus annuus]
MQNNIRSSDQVVVYFSSKMGSMVRMVENGVEVVSKRRRKNRGP